jgi:HopJ type III effector protein
LLSYAALSQLDKDNTLKLWGQYYREVKADPNGSSHQNIRNFMKYGWEGTSRAVLMSQNRCLTVVSPHRRAF